MPSLALFTHAATLIHGLARVRGNSLRAIKCDSKCICSVNIINICVFFKKIISLLVQAALTFDAVDVEVINWCCCYFMQTKSRGE